MRVRAAPIVALVVCGACAQPCYRLCEERADVFEACFEPWYLEWGAFGVSSREEYVDQCRAVTDAERHHLDRVPRDELDEACRAAIDDHRAAADCDAQWEVFTGSADYVP